MKAASCRFLKMFHRAASQIRARRVRWSSSPLATRADERASLALEPPNNPSATVGTKLSLLPVDEMMPLVFALRAVWGEEIPDARSAAVDRLPEHLLGDVEQPVDPVRPQAAGQSIRMQAGAKENFICINITDPSHHLLMHQ